MDIKKLLPGDSDFHLFENLPKRLYPADSIRHRQQDTVSDDFLTACYVAVENGEAQARVALYGNPALTYKGRHAFSIGNYECVDDPGIASALLEHVAQELAQPGAVLIGPMNGSTWENYRFSLDHNAPNFFLEPYHHLYYNDHFLAAGFAPVSHYSSNLDTRLSFDFTDVLQREEELLERGMIIRGIDVNNFENELQKLYGFISGSFAGNFLYTPADREAFSKKYRQAAAIIRPEYVLIAEDGKGEVTGFIFCYDDLFNTAEKSLVIKTLARKQSDEWKGLGQILANRVIRLAKARGYASIIHAFMISEGVSTFASQKFLGGNYKNYVLYGKTL